MQEARFEQSHMRSGRQANFRYLLDAYGFTVRSIRLYFLWAFLLTDTLPIVP